MHNVGVSKFARYRMTKVRVGYVAVDPPGRNLEPVLPWVICLAAIGLTSDRGWTMLAVLLGMSQGNDMFILPYSGRSLAVSEGKKQAHESDPDPLRSKGRPTFDGDQLQGLLSPRTVCQS